MPDRDKSPDPHPAPAARGRRRRPTGGSRSRSRPSTPRATPAWSSAGWSPCSTSSAGPAAGGSPVRVMSFSQLSLRRLRTLAPDLRVGDAVRAGAAAVPRRHACPRGCAVAGPEHRGRAGAPAVRRARATATGIRCTCGPSTTAEDIALCRDLGVEAIITNRPGRVLGPSAGQPAASPTRDPICAVWCCFVPASPGTGTRTQRHADGARMSTGDAGASAPGARRRTVPMPSAPWRPARAHRRRRWPGTPFADQLAAVGVRRRDARRRDAGALRAGEQRHQARRAAAQRARSPSRWAVRHDAPAPRDHRRRRRSPGRRPASPRCPRWAAAGWTSSARSAAHWGVTEGEQLGHRVGRRAPRRPLTGRRAGAGTSLLRGTVHPVRRGAAPPWARSRPPSPPVATGSTASPRDVPVVGGPRAVPLRVRPPLQGLPRPGRRRRPPRPFVARPFEGLAGECDWVALREIVPGRDGGADPGRRARRPCGRRWPPCCRWPGRRWCARTARCSSACRCPAAPATPAGTSRDALERALDAEPGTPDRADRAARPGPAAAGPARPGGAARRPGARRASTSGSTASRTAAPRCVASMERANEAVVPDRAARPRSRRPTGARSGTAATCAGSCPHDEDALLDALARLHAAGADTVGRGLALRRRRSARTA